MIIPYPTQQVVNFCLPSASAIASLGATNGLTSAFGGAAQTLSRVVGDLQIAYPVIAGGTGAAMLVALFYVWLLKAVAGALIWGSILLVLGGAAAFAYFLVTSGQAALTSTTTSTNMANALLYSGYAMAGLTFSAFFVHADEQSIFVRSPLTESIFAA